MISMNRLRNLRQKSTRKPQKRLLLRTMVQRWPPVMTTCTPCPPRRSPSATLRYNMSYPMMMLQVVVSILIDSHLAAKKKNPD